MTTLSDTPGEGLAPCPFCGGEAELKHGAPDGYFVWHKCGWKGFASEMFGYRCSTEADAIAAWNRRSPSVASDTAALPSGYEGLVERLRSLSEDEALYGSGSHVVPDALREAAEAIAALGRVRPVAVKPLEWMTPPTSRTLRRAETAFGTYRTWTRAEADGKWFWEFAVDLGVVFTRGDGESEEAVKAAAQAHYEQGILSALATPPAPQPALALIEELTARIRDLEKRLASCQWYWPEDDTSSECCSDCPSEVIEGLWDYKYGDVIGISRGGVVETRYHAWLEPADDADSDDNFEVDEATREEAKAKVDTELARRAALANAKRFKGE